MKKLICALLTLAMVFSLSVSAFAATSEKDFSDFPIGWSHDAMKAAVDNSLLQGSNGKIDPSGVLTRAQMAAVLVRAMGGTAKGDLSSFTDVSSSAWYYNELSVAVGMKLIKGSGTLMRPNAPISREETAAVLARALCLKDGASDLSTYTDAGNVSTWAKGAMSALVEAGYMKGDGKTLSPKVSISRQEFAQLMYNMISTYYATADVYTGAVTGNLVVKADGTTLDGATIKGDVIIGDGVGNGTVTIQNCKISGRIVARGGGENSVVISNTETAQIVAARPDGALHISAENMPTAPKLVVADGDSKLVVDGDYSAVEVEAAVPVVIASGTVQSVTVAEDGASLTVEKSAAVKSATVEASGSTVVVKGTVEKVEVAKESANANIEVAETGVAKDVVVEGTGATVGGAGKVEAVTVSETAAGTSVTTADTKIANNSTDPVKTESGTIEAGKTETTNNKGGVTEEQQPSGGGGAPTTYYKLTVSITKTNDSQPAIANSTTSTTLSGSTPFYAQASSLVTESIRTALKNRYSDANARAVMDEGLAAFGDSAKWTAFVGKYFPSGTASSKFAFTSNSNDSTLFADRLVTFQTLAGPHTITYGEYTVTVTIAPIA